MIITSGLVLTETEEQLPLAHPRILWDNILRRNGAIITPSSEVVGHEASNIANALTWNSWSPVSLPANCEFEIDEAEQVDCAMIVRHTLGSTATTVVFQYWNGSAWVNLHDPVLPGNDKVMMFLFSPKNSSRYRIVLTGSTAPFIAVVAMGKVMVVERRLFRGHTPITMGRKTEYDNNISEGGEFLGRSIVRHGSGTTIAFKNLNQEWVREKFMDFVEAARTFPFGWAWYPDKWPDEVAYCWTDVDIHPNNTGPRGLMGVSFPVKGITE